MTCHLRIWSLNRLLRHAQHYDNPGGAVDVRSAAREQTNIRRLRSKVRASEQRAGSAGRPHSWRKAVGGLGGVTHQTVSTTHRDRLAQRPESPTPSDRGDGRRAV
jgi:hypothetical protein